MERAYSPSPEPLPDRPLFRSLSRPRLTLPALCCLRALCGSSRRSGRKRQPAPQVDHSRLRGHDRAHYLHEYNFLRRTQKWDINHALMHLSHVFSSTYTRRHFAGLSYRQRPAACITLAAIFTALASTVSFDRIHTETRHMDMVRRRAHENKHM